MDKLVAYAILDDEGSFTYGLGGQQTFETKEKAEAELVSLVEWGWQASALTIVGLIDLEGE
jgi:hypothetical protein